MTKPSKKRQASKLGLDHPAKTVVTSLGLPSHAASEVDTAKSALVTQPETPEPALVDAISDRPYVVDAAYAIRLQGCLVQNDNDYPVTLRVFAGERDAAAVLKYAGFANSWQISPKRAQKFPGFSLPIGSKATLVAYSQTADGKGGPIGLPLRVLEAGPHRA
jgi:hypothetical protein